MNPLFLHALRTSAALFVGCTWLVLGACSGTETDLLEGPTMDSGADTGSGFAPERDAEPVPNTDAQMLEVPDAMMSQPMADAAPGDAAVVQDASPDAAAGQDASPDAAVCECAEAPLACAGTEGSGTQLLFSCDHEDGCTMEPAGTLSCARSDQVSCNASSGSLETRSARCKPGQGCTFDIEQVTACPGFCAQGQICGGGCDVDPSSGGVRCLPCRPCADPHADCNTWNGEASCMVLVFDPG